MNQNVQNLKDWFEKLSDADKREVIEFLYDGRPLNIKASGGRIKEARSNKLFLGPSPSGGYCSQCGSPL